MTTDLDASLAAISRVDEERRTFELRVWSACSVIAPELTDLFADLGVDPLEASGWLCAPNSYLAGRRPAALVADGHAADIMALLVRSIHGIA